MNWIAPPGRPTPAIGCTSPIPRDLREIDPGEIVAHDWLVGGWPCQPWSRIGKRQGLADHRGRLIYNILAIVEHHRPQAVLLKNVPRVARDPAMTLIASRLVDAGYQVHHRILDAQEFGLAQRRRRLFILALRSDQLQREWTWPRPNPLVVNLQSILQPKDEIDPQYILSPLACHHVLTAQASGKFKPQIVDPRRAKTVVAKTLLFRYSQIQRCGTYIRYGRTGLRRLTLVECKRLVGLPASFGFPVPRTRAYNPLGNAVSPPIVLAIAKQMLKALGK